MISNKTDDFKQNKRFQTKQVISNKMDDFKKRGVLQEYAVSICKKADIFGTRL